MQTALPAVAAQGSSNASVIESRAVRPQVRRKKGRRTCGRTARDSMTEAFELPWAATAGRDVCIPACPEACKQPRGRRGSPDQVRVHPILSRAEAACSTFFAVSLRMSGSAGACAARNRRSGLSWRCWPRRC